MSEKLVPPKAESQLVLPSLDKLVVPADPPEIAKIWEQKGFNNFGFFRLSPHKFKSDGNYPDWRTKPESWFWKNILEGTIPQDSAQLNDLLIAIDRTQKPDYDKGIQLYPNDPFGDLLSQLRKEGEIQAPKEYKYIPHTSRFGISPEEITSYVFPAIAVILEISSSQAVRFPKEAEANVISNRFHPEWGNTNTCEWRQDEFEDGTRLIGGFSANGLEYVRRLPSDGRDDNVGFRPLIVLSPKT